MQITDVTTIKLRFPMAVPMADAIHYMPDRPTLLVQVHTDEGLVGWARPPPMAASWKAPKR